MQKISAGWMEMLTEHARNPTAPLPPMLNRLQNRSLLLFGGSLDNNLWSTLLPGNRTQGSVVARVGAPIQLQPIDLLIQVNGQIFVENR